MCGIAGVYAADQRYIPEARVDRMISAISHRGPDGRGCLSAEGVSLGHARLAIIDLTEQASQPMQDETKRYSITYNGELYNYRELKRRLVQMGFDFFSNSDTEVVLKSFIAWGSKCLLEFNGMFAFGIYDKFTKDLFVARDRYGIKPLYYYVKNEEFLFASEQKAIVVDSRFKKQLNIEAIFEYFTFQNIFTNQTFFRDVFILEPGHHLTVSKGKDTVKIVKEQYWDFRFEEWDSKVSYAEAKEECGRLFEQAVTRQLTGDVEIGSYLSGGIDSCSIAAIASNNIENIKTFTCGFDTSTASEIEQNYDERLRAEMMASFIRSEHYQVVLKPGDMEASLPFVTKHLEEPRVGQSYPNYYATKLASRFVKVVFSGTGGDELFAGYPWRYNSFKNAQNFSSFVEDYFGYWQRLVKRDDIQDLFAPVKAEMSDVDTKAIFERVLRGHKVDSKGPGSLINHCLYLEAKTFLHGLLVVEDKLSMSHGLESRVPFLDNHLVDFATSCPISFKLRNFTPSIKMDENLTTNNIESYFSQTNDGKRILRDTISRLLPPQIVEAKKQGFSSPDESWFRYDSRGFVMDKLFKKNAPINDIINQKKIEQLIAPHFEGTSNKRLLIWSFLNVNEWLANNI